jgi:hAT family C-terminal dimerisation region
MFDNLPALSALSTSELRDELDTYLSTDPEQVGSNSSKEVVAWWYERRGVYPRLHRMALDYLTIPGK